MKYEVSYETTLPPWQISHEEIEAEAPNFAKDEFSKKYGYTARIFSIQEKTTNPLSED